MLGRHAADGFFQPVLHQPAALHPLVGHIVVTDHGALPEVLGRSVEQALPLEMHPRLRRIALNLQARQVHEVQAFVERIHLRAKGLQLLAPRMHQTRPLTYGGQIEHTVFREHGGPACRIAGVPGSGVFGLQVHNFQASLGQLQSLLQGSDCALTHLLNSLLVIK